jgi:hypothetical protein
MHRLLTMSYNKILIPFLAVALLASGYAMGKHKPKPPQPPEANEENNFKQTQQGPFYHQIYALESADGLTWTQATSEPLAEHASVPTVGMMDDRLMLYYVDATDGPEALGCMYSDDNGETFEKGECSLEGTPTARNVDFSFVPEADEYRLYYYSIGEEGFDEEIHTIRYATTTDGFHFEDQGEVFSYEALVDPDVFYNGNEWIIHVFGKGATVVGTSEDGTDFTYVGTLSPEGYGVAKPIAVEGGFRMYAFKQGQQTAFYSFFSEDGLTWEQEEGVRWEAPEGYEITDPSVVELPDGTYKMVYKVSVSNH